MRAAGRRALSVWGLLRRAGGGAPVEPALAPRPERRAAGQLQWTDEYGFLDAGGPALDAHLAAESRHCAAWMRRVEHERAAVLREASTWTPHIEETVPERVGDFAYWTRQAAPGEPPVLLRRALAAPPHAPPTIVLDVGALLDNTGACDVGAVKVSRCGGLVAACVDEGGDVWTGSVLEVGTGRELGQVRGAAGMEWGADGGTLFACVQDTSGRPAVVHAVDVRSGRWSDAPSAHVRLFCEADPHFHVALGKTKDWRWLTVTSVAHASSNPRVLDLCPTAPPGQALQTVVSALPGVETFVEHSAASGGLILLTNDAMLPPPAGTATAELWLAACPAPGAPREAWKTLVPRRPGVCITDIDVFDGVAAMYERVTAVPGARPALSVLPLGRPGAGSHPVRIHLPPPTACLTPGVNADPGARVLRLYASSPASPPAALEVDLAAAAAGRADAVRVLPEVEEAAAARAAAAAAATGLRVRYAVARSADGTPVPLTLLEPRHPHPAGPALLTLYGAYGLCLDADFDPVALALAARGWTAALAHGRGGGERGRAWHAAGRGLRRGAAAEDAGAALAWLVAQRAGGVVVRAESAGGLLAAGLVGSKGVAGVLLRAPFLDVLTAAGPAAAGGGGGVGGGGPDRALAEHEAGEWAARGDVAALAAACPYYGLQARPSTHHPPVLASAGGLDGRAPAAGVAKWAARLRAARLHAPSRGAVLVDARPGVSHAGALGGGGDDAAAADAAFCLGAVRGDFTL